MPAAPGRAENAGLALPRGDSACRRLDAAIKNMKMVRAAAAWCLCVTVVLAGGHPALPPPSIDAPAARAEGTAGQEPGLPDSESFISLALSKLRSNDLLRSQYTYQEKETSYKYGPDGKVAKTQVRIYEVSASPDPDLTYRRLVSEDGVTPEDLAERDADQRHKEQDWLARRELGGLDDLQARHRKREIEDQKERAVVQELRSIFDVRMTGREAIEGRPALVFTFAPRPGYSPRTPQGRIIKNFLGQAWVDEQDHELVRLSAEAMETTSVKLGFIVRLLKGSRAHIERRKIDDRTWLPTYSRFTGSARVLFVMHFHLDQVTEFSAYRRRDEGS